jgi:hypothetical protein
MPVAQGFSQFRIRDPGFDGSIPVIHDNEIIAQPFHF